MTEVSTDIWATIFSFVPLATRVELGRVNSEFSLAARHSCATNESKEMYKKMQRAAFFERHLDKVVWCAMSINSSILPDFFRRHTDKVDWKMLSENPAISSDMLEDNFDKLDFNRLMGNKGVPFEFFEKHSDLVHDWRCIVDHHEIRPELFKQFLDLNDMCCRRNVPMEILEEYRARLKLDTYCYSLLSQNESIPLEWLDQSKIYWNGVFWLRPLSLEWLEANLDKLSNTGRWTDLCRNKRVPIEFFERHTDKVVWYLLAENENATIDFFERHLDKCDECVIYRLSTNPNIPAEFFEKHAQDTADWENVLSNCKLSMDFLRRHLDHLNWSALSGNDSVPVEFLEEHFEKLDWDKLCLGQKNIDTSLCVDRTKAENIHVYREHYARKTHCPWPGRS